MSSEQVLACIPEGKFLRAVEKLKALPSTYDAVQLLMEGVNEGAAAWQAHNGEMVRKEEELRSQIEGLHDLLKARDGEITKLEAQIP